jgi:hypothetical protein
MQQRSEQTSLNYSSELNCVTAEICDTHPPRLQLESLFNNQFGSLDIHLPGPLLNMNQNILK